MLNAEMIVGLWFAPVVVFILIPLSVLCLWSVHKVLRKLVDSAEQAHASSRDARDTSPAPLYRTRPAV